MLFPQLCQKQSEQRSRSGETTSCDLIVELNTVAASVLPSLYEVALVGIKQTPSCSSFAMVHLRIRLCLDKFAHRRPRQFQFPCNRSPTPPLFTERSHVF